MRPIFARCLQGCYEAFASRADGAATDAGARSDARSARERLIVAEFFYVWHGPFGRGRAREAVGRSPHARAGSGPLRRCRGASNGFTRGGECRGGVRESTTRGARAPGESVVSCEPHSQRMQTRANSAARRGDVGFSFGAIRAHDARPPAVPPPHGAISRRAPPRSDLAGGMRNRDAGPRAARVAAVRAIA